MKDGMDEAICPLDYDAQPPNGGVILDDDLAGKWGECKGVKSGVAVDNLLNYNFCPLP